MIHLAFMGFRRARGRSIAAIVGIAALVSLAYVLSGVANGFNAEVDRTLRQFPGQIRIPNEATGLLTGLRSAGDGPSGSTPVLYARDKVDAIDTDLNIFGIESLDLRLSGGRQIRGPNEAIVDVQTRLEIGGRLRLGGKDFEVVGRTKGVRMYAGSPVAFIPLESMQSLYFAGGNYARFFVGGTDDGKGLRAMSYSEAKADLVRPVKAAISSFALTRTLLWLMIAAIAYVVQRMALLARWTDTAVLRCLGANMASVAGSLALGGAIAGVLGGLLGLGLGYLLGLGFPLAVEATALLRAGLLAFTVAVAVGSSIAGVLAVRKISPATALRSVQ